MLSNEARLSLSLAILIGCLSLASGCNRAYYRKQADTDAYQLVHEKTQDPRWGLRNYTIQPDMRSRMYHPYSQERPPMPPDDPSSHQLMEFVDGKPGYGHWDDNGFTPYVENPVWMEYLPLNEQGFLVLSLDDAYRTALVHSRDYLQEHEDVYLSALNVSLERFAFDSQFGFGYQGFLTSNGPARGGTNTFDLQTRGAQFRKAGITGTTFVVNLANTLLWQYAGPTTHTATTLVDFSLIQPLLRQAGRERILEGLTQSERTLLADIRALERFRRDFYLQISIGGPTVGGASGYLGLLQQQQEIYIREFQLTSVRNTLKQVEAFFEAGRVGGLQVTQARNTLLDSQQSLLSSNNGYETALDRFKIQLGLPPDLNLNVEDPLLDQFELIRRDLLRRQNDLTGAQQQIGQQLILIEEQLVQTTTDELGTETRTPQPWNQTAADHMKKILESALRSQEIYNEIVSVDLPSVYQDIDKLRSGLDQRVKQLGELQQSIDGREVFSGKVTIEPDILDPTKLYELPDFLIEQVDEKKGELELLRDQFQQLITSINQLSEQGPTLAPEELVRRFEDEISNKAPKLLRDLYDISLELSLRQVEARSEIIMLTPVSITEMDAVRIARTFRRDLMNSRATLVDQWRQIEFVADQLESNLDLVFTGQIQNVGDNPLDLRSTTGQLRAGVQFDAPLTRRTERNNYRTALITYQRGRRTYYAFEDGIVQNLREILRNLELNKLVFEIARRNVRSTVDEVENARLDLVAPPEPGQTETRIDTNATEFVLQALERLQNAQLTFLRTWIQYESLRRTLDFQLGTMQLDDQGLWIDPGPISADRANLLMDAGYGCLPGELVLPGEIVPGDPSQQPQDTNPNDRQPNQNPDAIPNPAGDTLIPPVQRPDSTPGQPPSPDSTVTRLPPVGTSPPVRRRF